jgi:hypothetical protein
VPVAATEKEAVWPAVTVWLAGWVVIEGGTGDALTVSVAAVLVTDPTELLTTAMSFEPLSPVVVIGVT